MYNVAYPLFGKSLMTFNQIVKKPLTITDGHINHFIYCWYVASNFPETFPPFRITYGTYETYIYNCITKHNERYSTRREANKRIRELIKEIKLELL